MLAFALAFLVMLPADAAQRGKSHPPIKHPPEVNVTPEVANRIYAAIDQDGMKPTAIEIAVADLFDVNMPVVLVFGELKKSSSTVCRGPVVTYEEKEGSQSWQRIPIAAYAIVPATDCQAPPKASSRIMIDEKTADSDLTGIVAAIRAGRAARDEKGANPELPAFTTKAAISAMKVRGSQAVVRISSPSGEEKSLLMVKAGAEWFIAAAGNDIALPNQ